MKPLVLVLAALLLTLIPLTAPWAGTADEGDDLRALPEAPIIFSATHTVHEDAKSFGVPAPWKSLTDELKSTIYFYGGDNPEWLVKLAAGLDWDPEFVAATRAAVDWWLEMRADPRRAFEEWQRLRTYGDDDLDQRVAGVLLLMLANSDLPEASFAWASETEDEVGLIIMDNLAESGYAPAQVDMSDRYATGRGTDRDTFLAYYWMLRAKVSGTDVDAALAAMEATLSEDEIEVANDLVDMGLPLKRALTLLLSVRPEKS